MKKKKNLRSYLVPDRFPRKREFIQKVHRCMRKARRLYPEFTLTEEDVRVLFYSNRYTTDYAWADINTDDDEYVYYFNYHRVEDDFLTMYYEIIPHEVAHMVYHTMMPDEEQSRIQHNPKWKEIAIALGSSGETEV